MISTDRILLEIDRQLNNAKAANDERAIRESLTAIRSLCEVVLGNEPKNETPRLLKATDVTSVPTIQTVSALEGKPLEEEDANGGSIFDF
ncbi:YwdI family protein [Sporosarcina contaminans]|uniref:YwdI family protein n=1 Tax=Sporosarcina contaminans TaxID=633403 RepID=A0ABW3TXT3_9BACL